MIVEPFFRSVRRGLLSLLLGAAVLSLASNAVSAAQTSRKVIDFIEIEGVIDPPVARYVLREIASAEQSDAEALVVRVDSPGVVQAPVDRIVERILTSKVPVVVWVAPSGVAARSASAVIFEAAHVAALAPGASLGPVDPPDLGITASEARKYLASLAANRGRNIETSGSLVGKQFDSQAAVDAGIADFTAGAASLYDKLDGRTVVTERGSVTLQTKTAQIRFHKMGIVDRLLHSALRPDIAYLLILLGMFGIIFELYHPGIGAAGLLGAGMLALGAYSLTVLPTSWAEVGILIAGVFLLWLDLQTSRFGRASIAGLVAMAGGSLLMLRAAPKPLQIHWWTIALAILGTLMFFVGAMTAAIRARLSKGGPISREVIGTRGVARTDIAPNGEVVTAGRTWRARAAEAAIAEGSSVRVRSVAGVVLIVEEVLAEDSDARVERGVRGE